MLFLVSVRELRKANVRARALEASARLRDEVDTQLNDAKSVGSAGSRNSNSSTGSKGSKGSKSGSAVHFSDSTTVWNPLRKGSRGGMSNLTVKQIAHRNNIQGSRRSSKDIVNEYKTRTSGGRSRRRSSGVRADRHNYLKSAREDHNERAGRSAPDHSDERRSRRRARDRPRESQRRSSNVPRERLTRDNISRSRTYDRAPQEQSRPRDTDITIRYTSVDKPSRRNKYRYDEDGITYSAINSQSQSQSQSVIEESADDTSDIDDASTVISNADSNSSNIAARLERNILDESNADTEAIETVVGVDRQEDDSF